MSKCTLVISVYDKPEELKLILYALSIQSINCFEIIIAEDGRNLLIKEALELALDLGLQVSHLTQSDRGFRKNKILNKAINSSNTNQLIFIDGDCIPHSKFIEAHLVSFSAGSVLCGRRVALGKKLSSTISKDIILSKDYQKIGFKHLMDSMNKSSEASKHIEEGLYLKLNIRTRNKIHILGCNFSIDKYLLYKINGFDENYTGPGIGEDSDLEYRLSLTDAKFISVRNKAILYHLYHPKTKENPSNMKYFEKVKKEGNYFCKNGLVKLN